MGNMVRFDGDRLIGLPPDEVYARLTSTEFLVRCLPDVEEVRSVEETHAQIVLRPGFTFVRGSLDLTLKVLDKVPETQARLLLTTKGIGSGSEVEAGWTLEGSGSETKVIWFAEVKNLTGLLKLVPKGLITGAAEKVIHDTWERLAQNMIA